MVRSYDTAETLRKKVEIASFLGTLQASCTDFRYLSKDWKKNTEEEALLGVSLTGIMDNLLMSGRSDKFYGHVLEYLKGAVINENKKWASIIGINPSMATTCVKPSGTVSQLVDSASGIHPRFSDFYIRRVRADKKDPLSQLMIDCGVPCEEDVMNPATWVFSFPMKAPEGSVTTKDITALVQLEMWSDYQKHFCEHKPSITVYYKDDEFIGVGAWVYENFDSVSGISFLPHTDHVYEQAPYEAITEDRYKELLAAMPPEVDWSRLSEYEKEDTTTSSKEFACQGGACEIL